MDGTDTVKLTATVTNDKNSAGVNWTVSGGGALSNASTTGATYTAPAPSSSALSVTVTATSVADSTKTGTATITVPAAPTVKTTSTQLTGAVGAAFSVALQGSGGIPPYKNWAVSSSGSALPACVTLSSAGVLTTASGTVPLASCAGTYTNLIFTYSDSGTPTPLTATSPALTLTIVAAPAIAITPSLPAGAVGTAYAGSVAASGGVGALTYSIASGALPPDLTLNAATGAITGTPKAKDAGKATFTIAAADAYGDSTTSAALSITVAAAPAIAFTPGGTGTVSLPAGTYNASYSAAISASGGAGTLTLTETGALPAGLAFASGTISGKPTATGTKTFTVQAVDAYGDTATQSYSIAVNYPPMSVTAATLPTGYLGSTYTTASLVATGGTGVVANYSWALANSTTLPAGLLLSPAGVISGKPTGITTGAINFQVIVTDTVANISSTATSLSITIKPGISIGSITLPTGYVGSAYPPQGSLATLSASGGAGSPYTWSWTAAPAAQAPPGLSIGSSSGAIIGTPTAQGSYSVVITASDSATPANTASVTLPITIGAAVTVMAPALQAAYPGTLYASSAFTASGGTNSGFQWSWAPASGSSAPIGLGIGAGTGIITGTPVNAGTNSVTANMVVTAKDSLGNTGTANVAGTIAGTLTVTTPSLPAATVGVSYNHPIAAAGGSGVFASWQLTTGASSLTAVGLSFNSTTGVVSGTTPTAGTATFSVTVTDSQGHVSAPASFTINVNNLLKVNQNTLPPGNQSLPYSQVLTASGGTGTGFTWTATSSNLATFGMSLTSNGDGTATISGTPTQFGSAAFTANVKDSNNNTAQQPLTIQIDSGLSLPASTSLPQGYVGVGYTGSVNGSGGSGNLTIAVTTPITSDGTLATSVSGATVNITGTPAAATTVSFGVKLTDVTTGNFISQTYSIVVSTPTPLVLPSSPSSLGSGTINQGYSGSITATGGTGSYYWMVNGTQVPTSSGNLALGTSGLGSQFTVSNIGGTSVLTVNGNPTSTGTVNFSAEIFDNNTHQNSSTVNYSITVNSTGEPLSGQVFFNGNYCNGGNSLTLPPFTISISTNPVQTTTTDSNGNYSFASIPNGTYTLTPSMVGSNLPEYLFTPGSLTNVVINNNSVSGENFNVMLGYTVSGTVSYGGSAPGIIYLSMNCGSGSPSNGTAITAPGPFTIRGVAPGNYSLSAWRDNLGFGQPNASNPAGVLSNVSIIDANLSSQTVTLQDPGAVTLSSAPQISIAGAWANGVMLNFQPIANNNGMETPQSYTVEWSTSTTFPAPGSGNSDSFPATGANGSNNWLLNTANVTGLTSGSSYYFRAQGVAGSSTSNWSSTIGPVTIQAPTTTGNTVSGTVTFSGTATGPLYVGFYDQSLNKAYAMQVGSKTNPPTSPANYSVVVPTGSNYFLFGIIDQNNDGLTDSGDITNTNGNNQSSVSISSNTTENLTLPSAAGIATVTTQLQQSPNGQGGTNTSYNLNFKVAEGIKLPAAVTLASGPNVLNPVDMGSCGSNCGSTEFQYNVNIGATVPQLTDSYTFDVTYVDGSTDVLTGPVTGVLTSSALATLNAPVGTGIADQPNFDWSYPANASNYTYSFSVCCGTNGNIWQIPGNNSKSNGFTNTQIVPPLLWGVDPTNSSNTPSPSALGVGSSYSWSFQSQDANGNSAQVYDNFTTAGAGALSLPATDPSTLPAAVLNAPYSGTIAATGGAPPYQYLASGSSCYGCNVNLSNGLQVTNAQGNTLVVGGTPTSTGTVTFQVTVKDSLGTTYGPVTYTVAVNNAAPISLPAANTNPLGGGLTGAPYGGTVNASGGSGSYSFIVNGTTIPTSNTFVTVASGDGLSASNSGGNTLFFAGTPITSETVSLTVEVIDTNNTSATATVTYAVVMSSGPSGVNNGNLHGTYVCRTDGYNDSDGSRFASLSSIVADGSGNFSSGVFDTNSRDLTAEISGTMTGTYSIGADNNGLATNSYTVTSGGTGSGTHTWALALTNAASPAQEFRMVETDDVGSSPSGQHGTANCYLATTSAFNVSTIDGNGFAFGLQGENSSGTPKAYVGRFSASGGNITSGILDGMRVDQTGDSGGTVASGTYTSPDTNGRLDMTLNPTGGGGGITGVVSIIDSNRMFMLETAGDTGIEVGDMRTQQQSSYSAANLNGAFVLYSEAWDGWNGSSVTGYDDSVFQGTATSSGLAINESYQDNNGTFDSGGAVGGPITPTFDSSNPGRVTFPVGSDSGYLYMFNNNSAFYLDLNGSNHHLEFGWIEPQSQTTFTNAAVAGTYMLSDFAETQANNSSDVGEIALASSGAITANISNGGQGAFTWDQSLSGLSYSWLSSTYGSLSMSGGGSGGTTCVVVSSTKTVCLDNTSSSAKLTILQQ